MNKITLKQVLELYQLNKTQFAELSQIPYKTLDGWDKNGVSNQGILLLEKYIEIKELENKHLEELEQYKEKANKYDIIRNALK